MRLKDADLIKLIESSNKQKLTDKKRNLDKRHQVRVKVTESGRDEQD